MGDRAKGSIDPRLPTITFLKTAIAPETCFLARFFARSRTSKSENQMEHAIRDSTWKRSNPFQNLHIPWRIAHASSLFLPKKKKNPVTETESITELSRIVVDRGARGRKKSERRREKKCEEKRMIKKKRDRERKREKRRITKMIKEREREKSLKPRDRLRNRPISETEQRDFRGRVYNFPVVQRPYQNEPEYPNHPGGKPCWRAKVSASLVTFPGARPSFSRFIDR